MNCLRRAGDFDPPGGNGRGNSFQFHHLLGVADATAGNSSHPCRPHSQALPDPSDFRPAPARNANHARGPCCAALARTARTSSSLSSSTSDSTQRIRSAARLLFPGARPRHPRPPTSPELPNAARAGRRHTTSTRSSLSGSRCPRSCTPLASSQPTPHTSPRSAHRLGASAGLAARRSGRAGSAPTGPLMFCSDR